MQTQATLPLEPPKKPLHLARLWSDVTGVAVMWAVYLVPSARALSLSFSLAYTHNSRTVCVYLVLFDRVMCSGFTLGLWVSGLF